MTDPTDQPQPVPVRTRRAPLPRWTVPAVAAVVVLTAAVVLILRGRALA